MIDIDHGSGVPAYRQLAREIRARIERGEIQGRLPGEKWWMQESGLALGTVRKAIALLRDEGVVFTTRGLGTFTGTSPDTSDT